MPRYWYNTTTISPALVSNCASTTATISPNVRIPAPGPILRAASCLRQARTNATTISSGMFQGTEKLCLPARACHFSMS